MQPLIVWAEKQSTTMIAAAPSAIAMAPLAVLDHRGAPSTALQCSSEQAARPLQGWCAFMSLGPITRTLGCNEVVYRFTELQVVSKF